MSLTPRDDTTLQAYKNIKRTFPAYGADETGILAPGDAPAAAAHGAGEGDGHAEHVSPRVAALAAAQRLVTRRVAHVWNPRITWLNDCKSPRSSSYVMHVASNEVRQRHTHNCAEVIMNNVRIQTYALRAARCENVARRTATLEAAGDIDALSVQAHVTRRALVDICR